MVRRLNRVVTSKEAERSLTTTGTVDPRRRLCPEEAALYRTGCQVGSSTEVRKKRPVPPLAAPARAAPSRPAAPTLHVSGRTRAVAGHAAGPPGSARGGRLSACAGSGHGGVRGSPRAGCASPSLSGPGGLMGTWARRCPAWRTARVLWWCRCQVVPERLALPNPRPHPGALEWCPMGRRKEVTGSKRRHLARVAFCRAESLPTIHRAPVLSQAQECLHPATSDVLGT